MDAIPAESVESSAMSSGPPGKVDLSYHVMSFDISADRVVSISTPCQRLIFRGSRLTVECAYGASKGTIIEQGSVSTLSAQGVVNTTSLLACPGLSAQYGWPSNIPDAEKKLLFHASLVNTDLSKGFPFVYATGLCQLSKYHSMHKVWRKHSIYRIADTDRFLAMAGVFSDVRFAICAVAAAHMRSFTKSSQLVGAECKFRGLAMQAMVIEVQRVLDKDGGAAPGRFEGLVASSKLLAWEPPSRYDV